MANLPTNYLDDVFEGNRKYTLTDNGDGTYTITDVTEYTTEGSAIGAAAINAITAAVNANTTDILSKHSTDINVTLGTGWSSALLTVAVAGVTDDSKLSYDVNNASVTQAQFEAFVDGEIVISAQGTGTVTFKVLGDVPTISIPITIRIGV